MFGEILKSNTRVLITSITLAGLCTACAVVSPVPPEAHPFHSTAVIEAQSNLCLESGLIGSEFNDQIHSDAQTLRSWINVSESAYAKRVGQAEETVSANAETCQRVAALAPSLQAEADYLNNQPASMDLATLEGVSRGSVKRISTGFTAVAPTPYSSSGR